MHAIARNTIRADCPKPLGYPTPTPQTSRRDSALPSLLTPASIRLTHNILEEFNHSVVESAKQLRNLVTNKLILESENPDPRVRMRAIELLGKISDVGLFTEKSEVTITHQTTDDLKEKLRGKLARLVNPQPEVEDAHVVGGSVANMDQEFGFDDDD
jgi:hypothetical protein